MATITNSGTQAAVISTEHTLATVTTSGVYRAQIDLDNLVNSDEVEIRWYSKVLTGGTAKVVQPIMSVADDQGGTPVLQTFEIECPTGGSIALTLKQTAGTGRNFDWSIRRLDDATGSPTLSSTERDAIATALLDLAHSVETGLTVRKALRLIAAVSGGSNQGTASTPIFRNAVQESKARVTQTGADRSAVSLDLE